MKNKTIQQQIEQLKELVAWFDSEDFELELAKEKFEQADGLAQTIREKLLNLKNEVVVLSEKFDRDNDRA